jgi:hypothetical protein
MTKSVKDRHFLKPKRRCKDNIKIDLREVVYEDWTLFSVGSDTMNGGAVQNQRSGFSDPSVVELAMKYFP